MSRKLPVISEDQMVAVLELIGFRTVSQWRSHKKLKHLEGKMFQTKRASTPMLWIRTLTDLPFFSMESRGIFPWNLYGSFLVASPWFGQVAFSFAWTSPLEKAGRIWRLQIRATAPSETTRSDQPLEGIYHTFEVVNEIKLYCKQKWILYLH